MYEKIEKPEDNKSKSVAHSVTQKVSSEKQGLGFFDNRLEAVAQRKLKETDGNDMVVSQLMKDGESGLEAEKEQLEQDIAAIDQLSLDQFRAEREEKIRSFARDEYDTYGDAASYTPYYKDGVGAGWQRVAYRMCEDRRCGNEPGHSRVTNEQLKQNLDAQCEQERLRRIKEIQKKNTSLRNVVQR